MREQVLDETDFVDLAGFGGGQCDQEDGDVSDGAKISCGVEASDRRILHREGEQP